MGVKKNVIYSTFLTGANYIFPLITFPYVSRILGPDSLGENEYALRIVNYFLLFASLGIASVGTREIARTKENRIDCEVAFSSILMLNLLSTLLILALYFISILFFAPFERIRPLLLIGSIQLVFSPFLIEWLYKGMEDFPYITKRTLAIRILYVISIFIFVRKASDLSIYFTLTILSTILNAIFNWGYKRKYVSFHFKGLSLKKYLKPYLTFGLYALLTSMYISFNVVFLGIVSSDLEVGYYSAATKLFSVILAFFTSFSAVMMPRISNMLEKNEYESAKDIIYKSFELLYPVSLSLILIGELYAPQIITILSGSGYEGAITPFRIILPLILIIGTEQILIVQILTPMRKDKAILINSIVGSVFGLGLNLLLVPHLACTGSAIVWLSSELAVFTSAFIFVSKAVGNVIPVRLFAKNIVLIAIPMLICFALHTININSYIEMTLGILIILPMTFIFQTIFLKNKVLTSILGTLKKHR